MRESEIEVLLHSVLHEMDDDLKPWPPRMNDDVDIKQMIRLWGCPEGTARARVKQLTNGKDKKWQWIRVQGNGLRGIMVLRKNVSTLSHKNKRKRSPKANMEKIE